MAGLTNLQRSVDARLRHQGTTLEAWLASTRERGMSWEQMARELETLTGIVVSHETVRRWHGGA